jgi:serine/threonine-protein kinase
MTKTITKIGNSRGIIFDSALLDLARPVFFHRSAEFKAILGEGGSGVVYLAVRDDIGRDVAIKVLRDAWVSSHRRHRFLTEQRTLATLSHPAIARILDAGVLDGGTPWFALELIDGLRLDEYCRQHVTDLPTLIRLIRTICEAVQHAHERLVVHRDLKPSNILVTAAGQPKLLDFGIARRLEELAGAAGHTGPLRVLTPGYASPEELRGEPPGVRGDVYSLGKILGERLTELVAAGGGHLTWASRWGGGFERSATRDLRLICETASHTDPEGRYPTVDALARDLDAVLAGRPIDARPATYRYRARKFIGRNRRRIAAVALVLLVIGGLTAAYTRRLAAAQTATAVQAARSERLLRFVLGLFDGGDRGGAPPADLRVVSLLERGVREARSLDDDPRAQAEMFLTLGRVYQELGDLERADDLLTDALDYRLARPDDQPAEVVMSLVAMSELRLDQARLDAAQQLAENALERAGRTLTPTDPARVSALIQSRSLSVLRRERCSAAMSSSARCCAGTMAGEAISTTWRSPPRGAVAASPGSSSRGVSTGSRPTASRSATSSCSPTTTWAPGSGSTTGGPPARICRSSRSPFRRLGPRRRSEWRQGRQRRLASPGRAGRSSFRVSRRA